MRQRKYPGARREIKLRGDPNHGAVDATLHGELGTILGLD
jgi:hypothetical protein